MVEIDLDGCPIQRANHASQVAVGRDETDDQPRFEDRIRREIRTRQAADIFSIAFAETIARAHGAYRTALQVEHGLLRQRMLVLLEFESRRASFRVLEREARRQQKIGPLTVTVRLDRIDRLASGELAVVDYKTGRMPAVNRWLVFSQP